MDKNNSQIKIMSKLNKFWHRNPVPTKLKIKYFDSYWLKLSMFNRRILFRKWGIEDSAKKDEGR